MSEHDRTDASTSNATGELPEGVTEPDSKLVEQWRKKIVYARDEAHKKAFSRMKKARQWVTWGADKHWIASEKYTANVIGRHISRKTADLYAKNPTPEAKPRKMLDFAVWSGNPQELQAAQQSLMIHQAAAMGAQLDGGVDEMGNPLPPPTPTMDPMTAMGILEDYQAGMLRKQMRQRFAETLTPMIGRTWDLDFKINMKQVVRRALTTCVGYVRTDFYRTMDTSPIIQERITDTRTQLANLEATMKLMEGEEREPTEQQIAELNLEVQALQNQLETIEQEGVVYSYPDSDKVIIDPACRSITGFLGAGWAAEEFTMTDHEIAAAFRVDVSKWGASTTPESTAAADQEGEPDTSRYVWEVFNRDAQTTFVIAEGYPGFLREPAPPASYNPRFFPWIPVVFGEQELPEGEIYPPSDVMLLVEPQDDLNQSRQGLREHRKANRPLYVTNETAMSDDDMLNVIDLPLASIIRVRGFDPKQGSASLMVPLQKTPIDAMAYDTSPTMQDFSVVAGAQEAILGSVSGGTATENAIAEESRNKGVSEDVDSLDDSLSMLADMVGRMMIANMDAQTAIRMAGPGAVWPELSKKDIAEALEIKVVAGSSGRPNKAAEIANLERMMPHLERLPGINPMWLAKEALRRLEDNMDLDEAMSPGMPSIATINTIDSKMGDPAPMAGAAPSETGDPASDNPEDQGAEGGSKLRSPPRPKPGPQPAFDDSGALNP